MREIRKSLYIVNFREIKEKFYGNDANNSQQFLEK